MQKSKVPGVIWTHSGEGQVKYSNHSATDAPKIWLDHVLDSEYALLVFSPLTNIQSETDVFVALNRIPKKYVHNVFSLSEVLHQRNITSTKYLT